MVGTMRSLAALVPAAAAAAAEAFKLRAASSISVAPRGNCTEPSLRGQPATMSWTVSDWYFDASDRDNGESVIFRLRNDATGYTTECFRRGDFALLGQCFWVDSAGGPDEGVQTTFAFDGTTGSLLLNQTWTCDEGSTRPAQPLVFTAVGNATVVSGCNHQEEVVQGRVLICGETGGTIPGVLVSTTQAA